MIKQLKVSDETYKVLKQKADAKGLSVTDYVSQLIEEKTAAPKQTKNKHS